MNQLEYVSTSAFLHVAALRLFRWNSLSGPGAVLTLGFGFRTSGSELKHARYSCDSTDWSLLSTANSHLALEMKHLASLLALIHFFDNFREAGSGCRNISDEIQRDDKDNCALKREDRNICGSVPASCGGPIKCAGSSFIFDDMNPVLVINGGGWWWLGRKWKEETRHTRRESFSPESSCRLKACAQLQNYSWCQLPNVDMLRLSNAKPEESTITVQSRSDWKTSTEEEESGRGSFVFGRAWLHLSRRRRSQTERSTLSGYFY